MLFVRDWYGTIPQTDSASCDVGCASFSVRVRPSLLAALPERIALYIPFAEGGRRGQLRLDVDDRGMVGVGLSLSRARGGI